MSKKQEAEEIRSLINQLAKKFESSGQDIASYLEGLYYADYLTYWDYIHLDTLLTLQNPKTSFPDEEVFIIYHQITELYFKLILHEIKQMSGTNDALFFMARIKRLNQYFENLIHSFDIMHKGMEREQFLQFRMSLLPSSGFQSVQYRLIEVGSTYFKNLADPNEREKVENLYGSEEQYPFLYWKKGATELATGKKTLTLTDFEKKYTNQILEWAKNMEQKNLAYTYENNLKDKEVRDDLEREMRRYDYLANVLWPMSHFKSASHYLNRDPEVIKATGGTNWQKYLPSKMRNIMFFPFLWNENEKSNWGTVMEEFMK